MDILKPAMVESYVLRPAQGGSPAGHERSRYASAAAHILILRYR